MSSNQLNWISFENSKTYTHTNNSVNQVFCVQKKCSEESSCGLVSDLGNGCSNLLRNLCNKMIQYCGIPFKPSCRKWPALVSVTEACGKISFIYSMWQFVSKKNLLCSKPCQGLGLIVSSFALWIIPFVPHTSPTSPLNSLPHTRASSITETEGCFGWLGTILPSAKGANLSRLEKCQKRKMEINRSWIFSFLSYQLLNGK